MKIAVVNDIHVGKGIEHQGRVRSSSHLVEEILRRYLGDIIEQHRPDVLINLGDLIRSDNKETDLKKYHQVIGLFNQVKVQVIHMLGNHELKAMSADDIESIWHALGFNQKSFGSIDVKGVKLIWLGLEMDARDHKSRRVPNEQLIWLKEELKDPKPVILFTHCAIDEQDVRGNFFYEAMDNKDTRALFLENQRDIRTLLNSHSHVIAVVQAHLHYFHSKTIRDIPYITCPAMGDNICGPNVRDHVPEIYTILSYENNQFIAKAFSGQYCFAGYEGKST
jgi:hypothetical protein